MASKPCRTMAKTGQVPDEYRAFNIFWVAREALDLSQITGAAAHYRPARRRERPGHNVEVTVRLDSRARRVDDRPPGSRGQNHTAHPVRTVLCLEGQVEVELICEPAFDYGRVPATWSAVDGGRHAADASGAEQTIRLRSDLALGIEGSRVRGRHVLGPGDRAYCALSWAEGLTAPQSVDEAEARIAATIRYWRSWLNQARIPDHRYRDPIQRSALAIKGLTYMPTGAAVAALTTSLPETPGGERNWDYRYTWMRDATFMLQALHWLGLDWEADEFMQFVADVAPTEDGSLQIMYGIDGRRRLCESVREDLSGYADARPVRIGNAAFSQRQNDVFGAVLDSILLHTLRNERLPRRLWPIVESQAACATRVWRDPDQGIWEARGKPQHYVSSKLMCWVALDRASKLAQIRGDPDAAATWRATAEEIRTDVLTQGVSKRGVLRQHYETDALDASTLLAGSFKFLAHDDERLRNTVLAVAEELTENGFVLRYRPDETDDGLSGNEGTFVICSFWLVSAFAIVGEMQRARDLMERLLRIAGAGRTIPFAGARLDLQVHHVFGRCLAIRADQAVPDNHVPGARFVMEPCHGRHCSDAARTHAAILLHDIEQQQRRWSRDR
jgi:alpha,alpha-trehalase